MSTNDSHPVPVAPRSVPSARRVRCIALVAGVIAVLPTWGAGEAVVGWHTPVRSADSENPRSIQFEPAELNRVEVLNGALAVGVQGALLGLILGAALGVVAYEVVGAAALPLSQTGNPIAGTAPARLVASVAIGVGIALGAAFVATEQATPPPSA